MLNARLARSLYPVELAQFVVTTIAMMRGGVPSLEGYASQSVLYLELRKGPVDPGHAVGRKWRPEGSR